MKLGGQHFTAHVKTGQKVKKGDLLISFDLEAIKAAGYLCTTPMIVCNTDDYAAVKTLAAGHRRPRSGPAAGGVIRPRRRPVGIR